MPSCAVPSCYNHSGKKRKGTEEDGAEDIVFHGFPKDTQLSKLWIQKIKRTDSINIENAAVCSIHFSNDQYQRDLRNELLGLPPRKKRRLNQDAVPNKNLPLEKLEAEQTILQNSAGKQRLEERFDEMELELEFIKCALCLNKCPSASSAATRYNEGIHNQNPTQGLQRNITSQGEKDDLLKNQLRMIFLLRKILEIPQKQCCNFLEVYGDPSHWIDFCDSCSILVENAKTIFDQIILLQNKFEKLQNEIKNSIIQTEKFQDSVGDEIGWGVEETIRSFITQGNSNVKTIILKEEAIGDFSSDLNRVDLFSLPETNLHTCFVQNEKTEKDHSSLYHQNDLSNIYKSEEQIIPLLDEEREDKIDRMSSSELNDNTRLRYFPSSSLNSDDVGVQSIEEDCFPVYHLDFTCGAYDSVEQEDPLRLDETEGNNNSSNTLTDPVRTGKEKKSRTCEFCGQNFMRADELKEHKMSHTGEKPYECNLCQKGFRQLPYLRIHERVHTGEKPYQCILCKKRFRCYATLRSHEKTHITGITGINIKPYRCNYCGKGFDEESKLTTHETIHTCEQPYKCKVCQKGFAAPHSLNVHERIHASEKLYKCKVCEKSFVTYVYLRKHQKVHTDKKP